jgi:hypothetical protein
MISRAGRVPIPKVLVYQIPSCAELDDSQETTVHIDDLTVDEITRS